MRARMIDCAACQNDRLAAAEHTMQPRPPPYGGGLGDQGLRKVRDVPGLVRKPGSPMGMSGEGAFAAWFRNSATVCQMDGVGDRCSINNEVCMRCQSKMRCQSHTGPTVELCSDSGRRRKIMLKVHRIHKK